MKARKLFARTLLAAALAVGLMPSAAFAEDAGVQATDVAGSGGTVIGKAGTALTEGDEAGPDAPSRDDEIAPGPCYDVQRAAAVQMDADGAVAFSRDGETRSGDWGYYDSDGGVMVSGYYGSSTDVTIPTVLDGKTVVSVRFTSPSTMNLRSVTFPASVETVGGFAFEGMASLEKVTFPTDSRLQTVGDEAFAYTGLTSFTMPTSLRDLGQMAFLGCHELQYVQFNDGLEPLSCQENIVSGSDSFRYVSYSAIAPFDELVEFRVPETSANFKTVDGVLLSKDGTILYERSYGASGSSYTVPAGVRVIARYAFYSQTGLANLTLPEGLRTIHDYAFGRSGITSLVIPDSVTEVHGSICYECRSLASVVVGDGVTELGTCAGWNDFYGCTSLSQVILGESLEVIGNACFAETALRSVDIPASVRQINYGAFGDTPSLAEVTGAEGVETIYRLAFRNAGLRSFPFGDNLNFVSGTAFYGCSSFDSVYPSYLAQDSAGDWTRAGMTAYGDGTLLLEGTESYSMAYQVLDLVNQERAKVGQPALSMDKDLLEAAMQRAAETVVSFSHTRPDGQSCFTASSKASGENIAAGSATAAGTMDQWMNSTGHRENILRSSFRSIGVGCFRADNGITYWVQLFGSGQATPATQPADRAASRYVSVKLGEVDPGLQMSLSNPAEGSSLEEGAEADAVVKGVGTDGAYWSMRYTAENAGFDWTSSNPRVLSVDASGHVRALSAGTATLTATSGKLQAKLEVTVPPKDPVVFTDVVPGAWYEEAVQFASQNGLITGYAGTTLFGVGDSVTRAQLATILWRYAEPEDAAAYKNVAANETGMPDVAANEWWTAAANWAVEAGVINGVAREDGSRAFEPDGTVTREQMAAILANFNGVDADRYDVSSLGAFPDDFDVDGWAAGGMAWAVDNGIVNGVDRGGTRYLSPLAPIPREQAAAILMNAIQNGAL